MKKYSYLELEKMTAAELYEVVQDENTSRASKMVAERMLKQRRSDIRMQARLLRAHS